VITGDNGLGKSFILDCAWFSITHLWSQEVNSKLTVGGIARPTEDTKSQIIVSYSQTKQEQTYRFDLQEQDWIARDPGLQYHGVELQGFC
jgi:hypothetical protein